MSDGAIVRRAEFKRKRWYKRRARKRQPLERFMRETIRDIYRDFAVSAIEIRTPFLDRLRRREPDSDATGYHEPRPIRWGTRL